MRQLILKAPEGERNRIHEAVKKNHGKNTAVFGVEDGDLFITYLPNRAVTAFLEQVNEIDQLQISLMPRGAITLYPPRDESPDQVVDVQPKSSLEIYFGGIQSVGSWFGLIGYSLAAGLIVWVGLYASTVFLLIAAMLIAPFAGPAMNAALATAAGQKELLWSSIKRYAVAIGLGVLANYLITLIFPIQTLSPLMVEVSQVSNVALLLPLISGFAGALSICQSERDSLVSGAAVGILVAASLAPPVGLLGIGLFMMNWEIISSSIFRIVLQLVGIHLTATLVFYFYGKVSPDGIRFLEGSRATVITPLIITVLVIAALMFWQFQDPPHLRKASLSTELTEMLDKELKKLDYVKVISKEAIFTNTKIKEQSIVNFTATIFARDTAIGAEELKTDVVQHLKRNLHFADKNIYQVYQINVAEE